MKFGRMFANAMARRLAYLAVLALFALLSMVFGTGEARAQASYPNCFNNAMASAACPDEATAHAAARAAVESQISPSVPGQKACFLNEFAGGVRYALSSYTGPVGGSVCPPIGVPQGTRTRTYPVGATCAARPDKNFSFNATLHQPGTNTCSGGCTYTLGTPDPGQCVNRSEGAFPGLWCEATGTPTGAVCSGDDDPTLNPPEAPPECAAGQVRLPDGTCGDQGDCPVGQHKVNGVCTPTGSCPTGQVKGPDGSCNSEGCGPGQAKGSDGTCKPDENGDGEPDGESDSGEFSGGEDCKVPPQCSGDNIMCGQARIQWRIDCNTRKNRTITGGHCGIGGTPICTGEKCDAMEYSQLISSWRATCAMERMANGTPGGGGDGGDGDGEVSWDVGSTMGAAVDAAAGSDAGGCGPEGGADCGIGNDERGGTGELDSVGLGFGRSCPALPVVAVMGATLDFNTIAGGKMCDWMALGGQFVLILAALLSIRILSGGIA